MTPCPPTPFLGVHLFDLEERVAGPSVRHLSRILGGPSIFAAALAKEFEGGVLPPFVIGPFALALPWLEASIGLLILVGAFTRFALLGGALLIVVLTFGATVHQDWDIAGLQLVYAVVYFGLPALVQRNRLSLDYLAHSRRPTETNVSTKERRNEAS